MTKHHAPCGTFGQVIGMAGARAGRVLALAVVATGLGAAGDISPVDRGLLEFQQGRPAEALEDWQHAAAAGDPRGALYIGVLYDIGRFVPHDYHQAMVWYSRAADLGSAAGAFNVGIFYDAGLGISPSPQQAASWYARAAAAGSGRADYNLALMYETGAGVPLDRAQAAALYRRAAGRGITAARLHLALLGQKFAGAAGKPDDPAMQGFLQAQHVLLSRGPADAAHMAVLMRQSADQHNALAEYDLGYCYQYAMGVPRDVAQALDWYRRAANDSTDETLRSIAQAGVRNLEGSDGEKTRRPSHVMTAAADASAGDRGVR